MLQEYESRGFFPKDTLPYPEIHLPGIAGDPVPYMMRADDVLVCFVLLCFIMTTAVFAHSRQAIFYQLKEFFYVPRTEYADTVAPGNFVLLILNLQTCLLFGITYYFWTTHYIADTYLIDSPYDLMAVYAGVFAVYFLMKTIVYQSVNTVFFESKKNKQMVWTLLFVSAMEGIAFFPAIVMQVYFGLSVQTVAYYFIFVLVTAELLIFYKCWAIFFRQISAFLQIILYLCALEVVPLLILGGALVTITNELKVIF